MPKVYILTEPLDRSRYRLLPSKLLINYL